MVVAQLEERLLPKPEIDGLNLIKILSANCIIERTKINARFDPGLRQLPS